MSCGADETTAGPLESGHGRITVPIAQARGDTKWERSAALLRLYHTFQYAKAEGRSVFRVLDHEAIARDEAERNAFWAGADAQRIQELLQSYRQTGRRWPDLPSLTAGNRLNVMYAETTARSRSSRNSWQRHMPFWAEPSGGMYADSASPRKQAKGNETLNTFWT